jgi:hypothetical protein
MPGTVTGPGGVAREAARTKTHKDTDNFLVTVGAWSG